MFNNARTYNQEDSWVYIDAVEMEKVLDAAFTRAFAGSGLPGAEVAGPAPSAQPDEALTPMEEDEQRAPPPPRSKGRRQIVSDDEYLTQSDDE